MSVPAPHFLLYAEAAPLPAAASETSRNSLACASGLCEGGRWRFVLRLPGGETSLEVADEEPEATPQRLELLAVVRGLEALSQPSRVTLLTGSRYLRRGLDSGISQWRESDWQWERYGRMAPVKNSDLWQRLDRLLNIHALECKPTRLEKADDLAPPQCATASPTAKRGGRFLRIDTAHSEATAESGKRKAGTNWKFKRRNDRKARGLDHWNGGNRNLFGAWTWVLGVLGIKRRTGSKRQRQTGTPASRMLAHRLQTRSEES